VKVYVEPSHRRIAPFDDPPSEVLIANRTLGDWQARMFRHAGLTVVDRLDPPCLVVPDTLFTTGEVLHRFAVGAAGQNAVLVLAESLFGRNTTHVQPGVHEVVGGWRFDAVRFVSGGDEPAQPVVIDPEEKRLPLRLPPQFGGPTEIALPRHPVMTVHHWVHILWANQAAGSLEVRSVPRWKGILRLIWAFLRCWSFNKWRVLSKLNTIGRNCDIHPTAVIEGSTLGDGVSVGPHARILFSRIGDGASILSGAEVEVSTVGEGATVGERSGLRLCVLYPEVFTSQFLMQSCVLGRGTLTVAGSFSIDLNFDREVRVSLDGELHDTGTRFLGSAFGHGCRIGTGVWLASGRAIPNGAVVVRDSRGVIAKVPETAAGGPMVTVDGALVPLQPKVKDPNGS
jgi:carbonic anhydrase/acetyltransferase-like protein (isoleucine patch superfamily)